ncbi:MAG TPA: adenylyltransferase/cytidyltransferase family protein [Thermoanaerobaculia bacterium]|nr:adenylyltransferase/cytidyltransferase family protein [Thermoanaerobaculia bacterium]
MVDMTASLIHHGHVRLLKAAKELGTVIVALTTDDECRAHKGYTPELDFGQRREILESIRYVDEVVPSPWLIDDAFLDEHHIDLLVHGHDNANQVRPERLVILPRTAGVSSSLVRRRVLKSVADLIDAKD